MQVLRSKIINGFTIETVSYDKNEEQGSPHLCAKEGGKLYGFDNNNQAIAFALHPDENEENLEDVRKKQRLADAESKASNLENALKKAIAKDGGKDKKAEQKKGRSNSKPDSKKADDKNSVKNANSSNPLDVEETGFSIPS